MAAHFDRLTWDQCRPSEDDGPQVSEDIRTSSTPRLPSIVVEVLTSPSPKTSGPVYWVNKLTEHWASRSAGSDVLPTRSYFSRYDTWYGRRKLVTEHLHEPIDEDAQTSGKPVHSACRPLNRASQKSSYQRQARNMPRGPKMIMRCSNLDIERSPAHSVIDLEPEADGEFY